LLGWLKCGKFIISWLIKCVWQLEYVTLVDGENLSLFLVTINVHYTVLETLDSLIQGCLVDMCVVHNNINLRLLIYLLPDLPNAISNKLDGILHFLIHLALVT
jgi:hypothetical protein